MIPFASQRALGQDLATHLLNAHDNESVELADLRGAVAEDIHGVFAEWEVQAHALTKCQNYLYSLSINPDPAQGQLSRDQYLDYIDRTEESLGLTGQPRAVVFHTKCGREHCHVVWSRIDLEQEKAVQLAYDHQKLMMVTRAFARDHHLELPQGYFKDKDKQEQLSLYEMHQQRTTGLTKVQHQEQVTDAWRASDGSKAFVHALADRGYLLATGKRPYILVDLYGGMHSLPKLITDKSVRTKDIRAFLEKDYPPESLSSVEEAKKQAAQHRQALDDYTKDEQRVAKLAELKRAQLARRREIEKKQAALRQKQHMDRLVFTATHKAERDRQRSTYLSEVRRVNEARASKQPSGLTSFFGRISGMYFLRKSLRKYQDRKRTREFLRNKARLNEKQAQEQLALQRRQEMQSLDMIRQVRAVTQIEKRELNSLQDSLRKEWREQARGGRNQMPSLSLAVMTSELQGSLPMRDQFMESGVSRKGQEEHKPSNEFSSVAGSNRKEGKRQGVSASPKPASKSKIRRYGRKIQRDTDKDRER